MLEIIQVAGFVCGLVGPLLAYAQYGRLVRVSGTAMFMGGLGVLATQAGTVPQGPGAPILLFAVGFIVAALTPRVSSVGKLTHNRLRAIGYLLVFLSALAQFVVYIVSMKIV